MAGKNSFRYAEGVTGCRWRWYPTWGAFPSHDRRVEVPPANAEGVILADGGRFGGFSLFVKDGKLIYENNTFGNDG